MGEAPMTMSTKIMMRIVPSMGTILLDRRRTDAVRETPKACGYCGIYFYRRRINGRLQDFTQFQKLRFCSPACGNASRRGKGRTLDEKFWSKVDQRGPDDCWFWKASTNRGYGQLQFGGKNRVAHRVCWELTKGPIPSGLLVCHKCDERPCCNPRHLFLGTSKNNSEDMVKKGRSTKGRPTHRARDRVTGRFSAGPGPPRPCRSR